MWERFGLAVLHRLDPELAHDLTLKALAAGLGPRCGPIASPRLTTRLAGLTLPNPVGVAAGLDKNAQALDALGRAGFGFLEAGAVTPRAQEGNARPRLFRLREDQAAINRFGFNNRGMEAVANRLAQAKPGVPVGLNLGANKDSIDRAADYAHVLARCGAFVDFATVNVSSPNTEKLRELQGPAALREVLEAVLAARAELPNRIPVFVKIAPDLNDDALAELAQTVTDAGIAGVIATNTTLARDRLQSKHAAETGGLSGAPLFERSTRVLARLSQLTGGAMPLIGTGGVGSADQAYAKIRAGATAVQLYTGLVFNGLSLAGLIAHGLETRLAQDGFDTIAAAVGTDRGAWL